MSENTLTMPVGRRSEESTRVKICGITNLDDAMHAAECGAELLGFNFYRKSPRFIGPADAANIIKKLPETAAAVGVFVNESVENILDLIERTGIKTVQLHGDEGAEFVSKLRQAGAVEVIKAIRLKPGDDAERIPFFGAGAVLIDGYSENAWGGTGRKVDWQLAYKICRTHGPAFLAGGLSADNVREAVQRVRPFGVDACSRLESSPGRKDRKKVEAFVSNAKTA